MDRMLVLMGARASPTTGNENYILLTGLLPNHVAFLRRVETWMEVEEHPIARTSGAVSGISHLGRHGGALNDLDMVLRGCAKPGARRCSSINFRSLGPW